MELRGTGVDSTEGSGVDVLDKSAEKESRPRSLPEWRNDSDGLLVTIPGACRDLKLGKSSIYELCASGKLRAIKIGRNTRIVRASMLELIEREQLATV